MEPASTLMPDSLNPLSYSFVRDWKTDITYQITVLPHTFTTYDGKPLDTLRLKVKGADPEHFGVINLAVSGFEQGVVVELLRDNKVVTTQASPNAGDVHFTFIEPAVYFLRIIDDRNANGRWDAGQYLQGLQPERVFIYPQQKEGINVRANWENNLEFTKPSE